ncbi:MAG: LPXTG cell wall anchor domain-containing protein [Candidatus Gracilibacteria bacterium]|nr:LPXTG cell wall anchor domain-containing protein [Candidatus Gracilibacteria bacterium]
MNTNKILTGLFIFGLTLQSATAAYNEINCDTDSAFSDNKCNQCFDGGEKGQGEAFGLFSDIYANKTTNSKLLYKEEQTMPSIINLGGDKASWSYLPSQDDFWQYTPAFDALYSSGQEAYVIAPGKEVNWLTSKTGAALKLDVNTVEKGQNVGMLIFTATSHDLVNDEVAIDSTEHKECVLFKSGTPSTTKTPIVVENTPVKKLPQTGPEHILLLFIALIAGLGFTFLKRKTNQ